MEKREIKFRVWNDKNFNIIQFDQNPIYWVKYIKDGLDYQQYTGLLDKNGKEIYEGDICKFDVSKGREGEEPVWGEMGRVEIGRVQTHIGGWSALYCDNMEIVGNIYENPELLSNLTE